MKNRTSFKDDAVVGDFVPGLQAGTVPAMSSELVLALMDRNLDSLDRRGGHVRITHAHLQLAPRQAGQRQTHRVGVQDGVDVREFQAQDFIGFHPGWGTWDRLIHSRSVHLTFLLFFLNWEIEVSHQHPVPTVPNRLIG